MRKLPFTPPPIDMQRTRYKVWVPTAIYTLPQSDTGTDTAAAQGAPRRPPQLPSGLLLASTLSGRQPATCRTAQKVRSPAAHGCRWVDLGLESMATKKSWWPVFAAVVLRLRMRWTLLIARGDCCAYSNKNAKYSNKNAEYSYKNAGYSNKNAEYRPTHI